MPPGDAGPSSDGFSRRRPPTLPGVEIPMVREQLRRVGGDLFTPQAVAIGPYHRCAGGSSPFPWTENKKVKAVEYLEGTLPYARRRGLENLVARLVPQVMGCYTHPLDPDKDSDFFHHMLLHDGCYLLDFFIDLGSAQERNGLQGDGGTEQVMDSRDNTVVRDILYLVENQIPLVVLDQMLLVIEPGIESATKCIEGAVKEVLQKQLYISEQKRRVPAISTSLDSEEPDLLHLVYSYFRRPRGRGQQAEPAQKERRSLTGRWRRATDYSRHADLRFKPRVFEPDEEWTILDVRHDGGTLYIPFLRVGSSTLTMMRNLIALEEVQDERPVTAYCYFLSQVACTAEDVDLLQRAKVLEHFLGSDEDAANGLADLCNGVAFDIDKLERNYLKPTWHYLDRRCSMLFHNFKGFFRETYCTNVFNLSVFLIALILFVCQVIQVIYAVLAYHKPPING